MSPKVPQHSFRDNIGTIDEKGRRRFLFPKKPAGKFYERRKWVSYALLAILVANPFVKINGNQFMMFNVLERRFNILGFPFWPQDFYLFVLLMITGVIFVTLFTVAFGRIFCGWICPQTIFLEMVFRRIEYAIDGDRAAQLRLDKQIWDAEKIRKRLLKWSVFFVISFGIANVFLAYVIGSDALFDLMRQGPQKQWGNFAALLLFTAVFYFVFVWFREQVCIIACPYGRLQGVLLDNQSLNVAYDFKRGEKTSGRGKFSKKEDRAALGKGDCIDCGLCVQVCPTGIDIRDGVQLECTNCTACIDACHGIMQSVHLPTGLIRYATQDEIEKQRPFVFTARMKAYAAVLTVLVGICAGLLLLRPSVEASVLRLPGQLYTHVGDSIRNVYTYKIVNKTSQDYPAVHLELEDPAGRLQSVGQKHFTIRREAMAQGTLFVTVPLREMASDKINIRIAVYAQNRKLYTTRATFLGPRTFN